jgi:hypothetical protein
MYMDIYTFSGRVAIEINVSTEQDPPPLRTVKSFCCVLLIATFAVGLV